MAIPHDAATLEYSPVTLTGAIGVQRVSGEDRHANECENCF